MRNVCLVCVGLVALACAPMAAVPAVPAASPQTPAGTPPQRMAAAVMTGVPALATVAPAAAAGNEVTIRWTVGGPAAVASTLAARAVTSSTFAVVQRRPIVLEPVRERDPQLSPDDLVVIAVDAAGRELVWQHVMDPRLIRSEQPTASGELRGQLIYRAVADLTVWIPAGTTAVALRIYAPEWNGREYILRGLGTVTIG
jgi:hypothetical protein